MHLASSSPCNGSKFPTKMEALQKPYPAHLSMHTLFEVLLKQRLSRDLHPPFTRLASKLQHRNLHTHNPRPDLSQLGFDRRERLPRLLLQLSSTARVSIFRCSFSVIATTDAQN